MTERDASEKWPMLEKQIDKWEDREAVASEAKPKHRWSGSEGADAELLEKAYEESKLKICGDCGRLKSVHFAGDGCSASEAKPPTAKKEDQN
jgi:hypothetical protein